jgi:hypothetical protein
MYVLVFVASCVGSGLCEELIIHSENSYRVCLIVCDLETSTIRRPGPTWIVASQDRHCTYKRNIEARSLTIFAVEMACYIF